LTSFSDVEMMQWMHPEMQGDLPPPSHAHSVTLVGHKVIIIGGEENASYYNSIHYYTAS
jgi:hypothetical protein